MPEKLIQSADKYIADTLNKGVLTPSITENVHANPESFNHTLENMYNGKYNTSYKTLDEFKSAYKAEYGDPFKKKEPIKAPVQPVVGDTKVSTFQPQETRSQISSEESLNSAKTSTEESNQDGLYSSGLLQKGQIPKTSSTKEDFSLPSEPAVKEPTLTFEEAKNITKTSSPEVGEYLAPLNRSVYDAIPQAIRTVNNIGGYLGEKVGSDPSAYTFEEYDKAYNESNPVGKAAMWLTGMREATLWHQFNEENMTASPEVEQSLAGQVSGGLGQGITMLAGAGAVNMLSKGSQVLQAAQYANALSKATSLTGATLQAAKTVATQPATYVAASQVFNSEFDDAYAKTGDADTAFKSAIVNTAGSAGLEAMPIMSFVNRLDKATGGGIKQVLLNVVKGGIEEATTEALQQALSNTVASNLYDETRTITDGITTSSEVGGLTGFALNVIGAALGAKLRNTTDPYEAQEIKKTQEYVQEKKAVFDKEQEQVVAHMENQIVSMNTTEMQKAMEGDNITTQQYANATQVMQTMPNNEEIQPKTIGLTSKINDLLVEKQQIYSKATSIPQIEAADARTKEIDSEIRKTTDQIGEVYALPSQKIIATSPEAVGTKAEQEVADGGSVNAEVSGVPETTASPFKDYIPPSAEEDLSDPEVVATKYHEERTNPQHVSTKEQAIAQIISSGVSRAGVKMQGDQNRFTNSMARSYLKEGGNTIDQVAQQASTLANEGGDGTDISPEDVWDFMQKYQQGPDQIDRAAGNPRLAQLSDKYKQLTGKRLGKAVAKRVVEAKNSTPANVIKDPETIVQEYKNAEGAIDYDKLIEDDHALPFLFDLNEEEHQAVKDYVKRTRETQGVSSTSTNGGKTEQATSTKGEAKSEKITLDNKVPTIQEVKSKKLTHIKGVNMGSGIASGTYLSTESGNRYHGRGRKFNAEVEIENPYTPSENSINEERNNILSNKLKDFSEIDFEGATIPENPTIDDLSDSGTEKLAKLFTKDLQDKGYDSMYLPESKTQEGELVIFDKSKVKLTEDPTISDAMKMSREQYAEKYPEGNYDEARAEYTKNTENLEEANKKGETLEGVVQMAGMVKAVPMDTRFTKGTDKIKQAWIKATRVGGAIPYDLVFNYSYIRKNTIAQSLSEVETQAKNVEKAINKHLGGKKNVTEKIKNAMDQVLHGETPSIALPSEVLGELSTLRSTVTGLSKEMINSGMLTDQMQATFTDNMDTYLNRSYKKWNDPVWKDNIPEDIMNKAVAVLKNEYIDFYKSKYEKAQAAYTNKGKRIRDFRTKISNQQEKINKNEERLSLYKAKHEDYISRLDTKLNKLKKKPNKQQSGPDLEGKTKKTKLEKRIEYLESVKSEAINDFNKIYDAKKAQFDKQNEKISGAITQAEEAAYNLQQRDYPAAMQASLDKFTSPDDGEISALINQLLYAPTQDTIQTGKAGSIQSGLLKQRSEKLSNSPEIRDLLGEYKDPYINFLNTTHKMITAVNNYKFQKDLRAKGMGVIFSDKPNGDFHRKIEGDAFKGLTEDGDIYTTETFEEALKQLNGGVQNGQSPGMKTFRQIVSLVKVGKTAVSTPGAFANYVSNVWNITSNAWNPTHAIKKFAELSRSKSEWTAEVKDLKKLGVLGQGAMSQELGSRIKEAAGYVPIEKYARAVPFGDPIVDATKFYVDLNKKIFEYGDDYARVIGFYAEVERYRTAKPDWNESQLRENAAKILANNSPTYDFAYPWVQNLRNSPWFSTFATFPAEIYRTTVNQAKQIKKDLSQPETRAIGAARVAGLALSAFGSYEMMEMSTTMIAGDDDDEKDLNLFVPEYSKNNPILYLNKDAGKYTYIDAGRFTYYNNFIAPILAYSHGNIEEDALNDQVFRTIREMARPFTDVNIVTEAGADAIYGYKTGTDEKIYSENDSNGEKLNKLGDHLINKLEPTNLKVARSFYDLAAYGKTKNGSEVTLETALMSSIGIKSRILDVNKQYTYQFYQQKEQGDADKNAFERAYANARSDEEKSKAIEVYKTQTINQINKMSYIYHAALRQGASSADINKHTNKMPDMIKRGVKAKPNMLDPQKLAEAQIKIYIKDIKPKK